MKKKTNHEGLIRESLLLIIFKMVLIFLDNINIT